MTPLGVGGGAQVIKMDDGVIPIASMSRGASSGTASNKHFQCKHSIETTSDTNHHCEW